MVNRVDYNFEKSYTYNINILLIYNVLLYMNNY